MMINDLEKLIISIKQAVLLERKSKKSLPIIISAIKKAKNEEGQGKTKPTKTDSVTEIDLETVIEGIRKAILLDARSKSSLPQIIKSIKNAIYSYWREEHLPHAEKIATALAKGVPTPVLTICGKGTREIRFTRYLAYYLDPGNKHGLGDIFLKTVFKQETSYLIDNWTEKCQVVPEMWIGKYTSKSGRKSDCYCDIGIVGQEFAIIIEQKILSGEDTGSKDMGLRQLNRYNAALANNPEYKNKNLVKLYLTPTGIINEKATGWHPLSHSDLITRAATILKNKTLSISARENLRSLLVDLSAGPYRVTEQLFHDLEVIIGDLHDEHFKLNSFLKYRRLVEHNKLLLNLILEGS